MFICEIWYQFCKSGMSKYGYLEVFQRVPLTSRSRESTVHGGKGRSDIIDNDRHTKGCVSYTTEIMDFLY